MQQQETKPLEKQEESLKHQDMSRVIVKFASFLYKKNLLEEFKKQHTGVQHFFSNIESKIQKPAQKKKNKKKKKQIPQQQQQIEENQAFETIVQQIQPQIPDKRWKAHVRHIEQFMKNQYYLFQNLYYKLKSATHTLFQYNFKLDVVNTRNNKRQEIIVTKNKRIFWVSTMKIELSCLQNRYFVQFPSKQIIYIQNPIYLQAIKKYWNKATFYAVVPTTLQKEPYPQIIMIQFDY